MKAERQNESFRGDFMIALIILSVILFLLHVVFEIPGYAIILGILSIIGLWIAIYFITEKHQQDIADSVLKAELIEEISVYRKKTEYKGYSTSWTEGTRHNYEYVDVFDHKKYVFKVKYKDGSLGILRCKEGSTLYGELIKKQN